MARRLHPPDAGRALDPALLAEIAAALRTVIEVQDFLGPVNAVCDGIIDTMTSAAAGKVDQDPLERLRAALAILRPLDGDTIGRAVQRARWVIERCTR